MSTVEMVGTAEELSVETEALSDSEIVCLNLEFQDLTPTERIERVQQRLGSHIVAASSFGPTAPVMLKAVSEVEQKIPVVTVRHHHETLRTLELINLYSEEFGLDLKVKDAPVLPIPRFGSPAFAEFQQQVKVQPFQDVLEEHQALAYLSGQMYWQNSRRAQIPFVERRGAVVVINPVLDIDEQTVKDVFEVTGWPQDPRYHDPAKGPDQSLECQLNTSDYKRV